jgi:hypothetical protein
MPVGDISQRRKVGKGGVLVELLQLRAADTAMALGFGSRCKGPALLLPECFGKPSELQGVM